MNVNRTMNNNKNVLMEDSRTRSTMLVAVVIDRVGVVVVIDRVGVAAGRDKDGFWK